MTKEAVRACRRSGVTMLGYETPSVPEMRTDAFTTLERRHLDAKLGALGEYRSQRVLNRRYFTEELVSALARTRGIHVEAEYAEAFRIMKLMVLPHSGAKA